MKLSLSLRLLLAAAMTTAIALVATAIVFNFLFRLYFEDRARSELETYLIQLSGNVSANTAGEVEIIPIPDPRFNQALSGYYWQVQIDRDEPLLSPSFWAAPLELARPQTAGLITYTDVTTGSGDAVAVASWIITMGEDDTRKEVFLAVAIDRADLDMSVARFTTNSVFWLGVLGLFLMSASWFQVRLGLKPLQKIRSEISRVSHTPNGRLSSEYPSEVLPLVEEVNQLLNVNAEALERARSRAGDLAHGLKTPLTIMHGIERKVRRTGNDSLADDLMTEITSIQHIVERELASTRDSHQALLKCDAGPIIDRLHKALGRQPGAEHIKWDIDVPSPLFLPFDEYDLTELLGNLLDNAVKWSDSRISVRGEQDQTQVALCVEDDGPGIPQEEWDAVLARGTRLDPDQPGTGLGLSIAQRMAQAHGCTLSLDYSDLGGVKVCLVLQPAINDAP
ncbi:sensor histidine kinase [Aliiroseovarius sp. KMU-71]|jgi:signal transduction histidine kinase|uniref:sensor histidine kinase n=1 Tax=unclassified Aliiroseovarius TaxID=2623558 RepID=UPI001FF5168D|nr:HAMP domain-containing sensor histidine kinase [Aliiroseovarius sp. S1123]